MEMETRLYMEPVEIVITGIKQERFNSIPTQMNYGQISVFDLSGRELHKQMV